MAYPSVFTEADTLRRVLDGASLARYGDGEFNLCAGNSIPCQKHSMALQNRLRAILRDSAECLVGIPNLLSETPKADFWRKYCFTPYLTDRPYGSSFISRPDSAPWINRHEYWTSLEQLWAGLDVTVVRGNLSTKGLLPSDMESAQSVREILCPRKDAFADYADILGSIGTPDHRVLLCLGPTATVLAVDLCAKGVHAVDVGHVALFWRKYRNGEPMVRTEADKALV